MKKTIAIAATLLVALFLTFSLTGGMFSTDPPVSQSYYLTNTDSIHSFYVAGYSNFLLTVVDSALDGKRDSIQVKLGGSSADELYPSVSTAMHELSNTTLATNITALSPDTSKTGVYSLPATSNYPLGWLQVVRTNMRGNAGVRTKVVVTAVK